MVNSKDIPKYLKENAKFCNWKYETRDGRLTKVPYNPPTNNKSSVNSLYKSEIIFWWEAINTSLLSWSKQELLKFSI